MVRCATVRPQVWRAWWLLLWPLVLLSCTIHPERGTFSCARGEACPPLHVCGRDRLCHVRSSYDASTPVLPSDAAVETSVAVVTPDSSLRDDAAVRDAGQPPDAGKGVMPSSCDPSCVDPTPICEDGQCRECAAQTRGCDGDSPLACDADGRWHKEATCVGDTPVCNAGVCGAMRLHGGLSFVNKTATASVGLRVVDGRIGVEAQAPACADVKGERLCVVGGIAP